MISNYFKTTLRIIWRHRVHSIINIVGLAVGMACTILILLWVRFEFSFDRYHENAGRIYRLATDFHFGAFQGKYATSNHPAGPTLQRGYPEVEKAVRFHGVWGGSLVRYKDRQFIEHHLYYADPTVFDVFTLPLLRADPASALTTAYSVVISEGMASKYFNGEDPLGKIIKIGNALHSNLHNEPSFTVTGVFKKVPPNSHFTFDALLSFETIYEGNEKQRERWTGDIDNYTYLLLAPGANYRDLECKLPALVKKHLAKEIQDVGAGFDLFLQPLTRIHLYSKLTAEISWPGFIEGVVAFIGIAVLILIIACINFMNLSTARSVGRAREIGVRKSLGADRRALVIQFMGESLIFSMISLFIALGLVELLMPLFHSNFPWEVNFENIYAPATLTGFLALAVMVGILAGSYPALVLSGLQPVRALKGASGEASSNFRSLLVVFQFTVTISLIANTVIVYRQFNHMQNLALGYDNRLVAVVRIIDPSIRSSIASIKAQLKAHHGIAGVAFTSHPPGGWARRNVFAPQGFSYENMQKMDAVSVDADFVPTLGVELAAGRNFDADGANSNSRALLINETAAQRFGWKDAVGKTITELTDGMPIKTVIGVMKDFHQRNLYNPIEPLFMENDPAKFNYALVKIHPGNIAETMGFLEKKWKEIDSSGAFHYWFLEDDHASNYRPIQQIGSLFVGFTLVAILIASMGLFGLALFSAERRTREIGIRKALGATVSDIARRLSRSSIKWVLAANIFAWPLTYWFSADWLEDYPYRIEVGIGIYGFSGLLALVIALLTVSWQAIKAARANPVDALRYE